MGNTISQLSLRNYYYSRNEITRAQ